LIFGVNPFHHRYPILITAARLISDAVYRWFVLAACLLESAISLDLHGMVLMSHHTLEDMVHI
jgi:hypothetical protein